MCIYFQIQKSLAFTIYNNIPFTGNGGKAALKWPMLAQANSLGYDQSVPFEIPSNTAFLTSLPILNILYKQISIQLLWKPWFQKPIFCFQIG